MNTISGNSLLAAVFGPGAVRARPNLASPLGRAAGVSGTKGAEETRGSHALEGGQSSDTYAQPVDRVELSSAHESNASNAGANPFESTNASDPKVRDLKQRDAEVRRHEQAHKSAAGSNASGSPTFEFTTGPDGKRYAVSGEVQIDTSPVAGDPQATIQKMQQIRRAALAPAQPSSQDRAVAAQAAAAERQARTELTEQRNEDQPGSKPNDSTQQAIGALVDQLA